MEHDDIAMPSVDVLARFCAKRRLCPAESQTNNETPFIPNGCYIVGSFCLCFVAMMLIGSSRIDGLVWLLRALGICGIVLWLLPSIYYRYLLRDERHHLERNHAVELEVICAFLQERAVGALRTQRDRLLSASATGNAMTISDDTPEWITKLRGLLVGCGDEAEKLNAMSGHVFSRLETLRHAVQGSYEVGRVTGEMPELANLEGELHSIVAEVNEQLRATTLALTSANSVSALPSQRQPLRLINGKSK